ncbi:MAG: hypothetical protein RI897_1626 [Verrucomicrobiota bacterium]|jgi:hypothetical protein
MAFTGIGVDSPLLPHGGPLAGFWGQAPLGDAFGAVDLNRQVLLPPLEVSGSVLIQAGEFLGYEKHEQQFQG